MTSTARPSSPAIVLALLLAALPASAQQRTRPGPIIQSAGAVFTVEPDLVTPTDRDYRVAFELAAPAASPDRLNQGINTVARFLNMHAQAGVPADKIRGAIVAHGAASFELMDDEAYRARFGVANPNRALIRELIEAGQPVILCGQSAASRGNRPRDPDSGSGGRALRDDRLPAAPGRGLPRQSLVGRMRIGLGSIASRV